ncbi:MAG: sulfur carrier protein ThiS [Cyclobacteriaceae bacterium]
MTVEVNKEKIEAKSTRLHDLLEEMRISLKGIAVAINNKVVSRFEWKKTQIKENDKITIIRATQGG